MRNSEIIFHIAFRQRAITNYLIDNEKLQKYYP